jgi:Arc/MetJ family transcription regulator
MRTNVEIDDTKIEEIRKMSDGLRTKKEIVDKALDELLNAMRRQRLRKTRGKGWDGNLDNMRTHEVPFV